MRNRVWLVALGLTLPSWGCSFSLFELEVQHDSGARWFKQEASIHGVQVLYVSSP